MVFRRNYDIWKYSMPSSIDEMISFLATQWSSNNVNNLKGIKA